jgi:uncharacterized membrane protein YeiB
MRVVGLDVHRGFAVTAILEGNVLSSGGRVELIPTLIDQNPWAQARSPMDMIFQGCSISLFQA